jgi:CrcB protein
MGRLLLVCFGGALGSGARYLVATWAAQGYGSDLPRGTLLVNLVGSFLITLILGLALRTTTISANARLFLTTGVMGGFTTYSSFNLEVLRLYEEGALGYAAGYLWLTVVGCLAAGALGSLATRLLVR